MKQSVDFKSLRERIRGPEFPVVIPFTEDQDVDLSSLYSYIDFLVSNKAPVILLTVGTSRFNLLTSDEIKQVNEVVVEAIRGRAISIVAGPGPTRGSTRENIQFAQHAVSIGADAILILYPERWYGDEHVVQFFYDITQSVDIGIMIHALPMRDGFGGVTSLKYIKTDVIYRLIEQKNIIGIKEESGNRKIFEEILNKFHNTLPIIGAGGAMRRFLHDYTLGARSYLVGIGSFKPELAIKFYNAVISDNVTRAENIAEKYEDPYFDFAVSLGWHRALKETLYLLNIMPPFERLPFNRINEIEREKLREVLIKCNWLKRGNEFVSNKNTNT